MNDSKLLKRRACLDKLLQKLGKFAIAISAIFLFILFSVIVIQAKSAFFIYEIKVPISHNKPSSEKESVQLLNNFIKNYDKVMSTHYLDVFSIKAPYLLISQVKETKQKEVWLPASTMVNNILTNQTDDNSSLDKLIKQLRQDDLLEQHFNLSVFTNKESREPQMAGILTSLIGSIYTIIVCLLVAIPISICTAIYLEEFAPKNLITTLVELNINNLAAVPSIVFGLLGLAVLINIFNLPRSAPITAGITLAMMMMPIMIINTRQAFRVIPLSIKHAALALGATKIQIIIHHTLPLAVPGIMTGIILSISRILGETAPLMMIGMLAFIVDVPSNIFSPATVLPVQIFLWADSPEYGFRGKTAAAILILLIILVLINMISAYIRRKYERKW
jgi:phosphate transport system permease protein